ncbi:MAG: hydrogenase expression protein HypE [Planctomycetota bacterium]
MAEDLAVAVSDPALTGLGQRYKEVHVFWLAGMSCDGCSIAVTGGTKPALEDLLAGTLPGLPKLILHHTVLAVETGAKFLEAYYRAWRGELDAPYVVVLEGSIPDEKLAANGGGYWSALGVEPPEGASHDPWTDQPIPVATWMARLAPGAAASIAIGTCATWGGVPAAIGNPTGSMGLMDFLGKDYRSGLGLPVVNIPGCSPVGDNFGETVVAVLLFLQGHGPLPEFDELGRPAWLFSETVHRGCTRAGSYEEGTFAKEYGDAECLVEVGCWGPVVQCNIVSRGAINGVGGCMKTGGICIGCTMPGFPDKFSPFYKTPPGSTVSTTASRLVGSFIRPLRRMTLSGRNRTAKWQNEVPSTWGNVPRRGVVQRVSDFFYDKLRFAGGTKLSGKGPHVDGGGR